MRVTNSMISNRLMLNVNRNMRMLDKYSNMIESTKRINLPSDDPILAARALKFKTNISETEQYQRNVGQGLSWMSATDKALFNVNDIMGKMRELLVRGTTGTNMYDDRQAITTSIQQLMNQLGKEMNATYAGRYVFSGYRTDKPIVYEANSNDYYEISQYFKAIDVESTKALQKVGDTNEAIPTDVKILKLPYSTIENGTLVITDVNGNAFNPPINVVTKKLEGPATDAYNPPDNSMTVHLIEETGEIVLGADVYRHLSGQATGYKLTYEKKGFKEGELNPVVNFECVDLNANPPMPYNMNGQYLEYEFGVNTRIAINTLGKDIYSDKLYADLRSFCVFVNNVAISDENLLTEKVKANLKAQNPSWTDSQIEEAAKPIVSEQLAREKQEVEAAITDRFNNLIGLVDGHAKNISTKHTDNGTRMDRLDLISERLDADLINYRELLSENEDTNLAEAGIAYSSAKAAYDASLKIGANILQLTLADFIR